MIRVDSSKCMGCGQCAAICPTGNIQIRGAKAEVLGNCMNCGHCYAICPAQAVQMPPEAGCVAQEQPDAARIEAADFLQLVRSRRSIRKYKPRPVEGALLAEILEAGRYMATAGNAQSVRYLVIQRGTAYPGGGMGVAAQSCRNNAGVPGRIKKRLPGNHAKDTAKAR